MRDDGYHLIDAEMVSLDLHDVVTIDPDGDGLSVDRPLRDRRAARRVATSSPRRSALVGRRAHVTIDKRIPHGGGLGGGSSDAAAVLRWAGFADPAGGGRDRRRRRRSASSAAAPGCAGSARSSIRSRTSTAPSRWWCRRSRVSTPAVYRAWDELGGPTAAGAERPRAGGDRGRARAGALARPDRRRSAASSRSSPGSGATWFVPGEHGNALAELSDEGADGGGGAHGAGRRDPELSYLRRWWRVRRSIFLCFFLRMRLRRFLTSEPIRGATLPASCVIGVRPLANTSALP